MTKKIDLLILLRKIEKHTVAYSNCILYLYETFFSNIVFTSEFISLNRANSRHRVAHKV